jgi:hypothetical protein
MRGTSSNKNEAVKTVIRRWIPARKSESVLGVLEKKAFKRILGRIKENNRWKIR